MAALGLRQVKEENSALFMTCVLRVNVSSSGWQKVVAGVVKNTNGVSNFRMNEEGMVEVSGTVDPILLLKILAKAGKRAEVCWFQFGQCSSNLYMPPDHKDYYDYGHNGYGGNYGSHGYGGLGYNGGYGGNNYYSDHRYLHYRGDGNRPRPRISYRVGPSSPPLADEGVSCCSLM